jgi:hypothetical protein
LKHADERLGSDDVIGFPLLNVCNQSTADHQGSTAAGQRERTFINPAYRRVFEIQKQAGNMHTKPAQKCFSKGFPRKGGQKIDLFIFR